MKDSKSTLIREQFAFAKKISKALQDEGITNVLAGGAPRDWLLDQPCNDLDFYVDMEEMMSNCFKRGVAFIGEIHDAIYKTECSNVLNSMIDNCIIKGVEDLRILGGEHEVEDFTDKLKTLDISAKKSSYKLNKTEGGGYSLQQNLGLRSVVEAILLDFNGKTHKVQFMIVDTSTESLEDVHTNFLNTLCQVYVDFSTLKGMAVFRGSNVFYRTLLSKEVFAVDDGRKHYVKLQDRDYLSEYVFDIFKHKEGVRIFNRWSNANYKKFDKLETIYDRFLQKSSLPQNSYVLL